MNEEEMCKCGCGHKVEDCDDTCKCHEEKKDCECNQESCNCDTECNCGCQDEKTKKESKKEKKDRHLEKLKKAMLKIDELEEQSLRDKAELVNYRKRKDEEVVRLLKYANEDLVKEMLPMIDNLERAIKLDDDNLTDEVSKFLSGVKMIYCSTVATLEKYGVKAIDGANKPFDPTYHQAVMTEVREGVEAGNVLEVLQKGYLLKDKVIRPAMVKVSA